MIFVLLNKFHISQNFARENQNDNFNHDKDIIFIDEEKRITSWLKSLKKKLLTTLAHSLSNTKGVGVFLRNNV